MPKQTVIVLNGTSSAGKTSIAKALQANLAKQNEIYLHFKMDVFWYMVPLGIEASSKNLPNMKFAIIDSAKALLDHGHHVIMDIVCTPENIKVLRESFKQHNFHLVAVKADLETTKERERLRGDRKIGMAESQYDKIHEGIIYDFEIDTTHTSAEECADILMREHLSIAQKSNRSSPSLKPTPV